MIFITVGSQKFQFNRVLKEVDRLIENKIIKENVFAQVGYSNYKPKNYEYVNFLDRNQFNEIINASDIIITHGGTGAIINAVKLNKKVIAVPRLKSFGEHVDNHQIQIVNQFKEMNLILGIEDIKEIEASLYRLNSISLKRYCSNTKNIIDSIDEYIEFI